AGLTQVQRPRAQELADAALDDEALARYLEAGAVALGVDAEPVTLGYGEAGPALARAGPALVRGGGGLPAGLRRRPPRAPARAPARARAAGAGPDPRPGADQRGDRAVARAARG